MSEHNASLAIVTPMELIQRASAQGASIEQMAQLFDLKLRVEADEAKKAFFEAYTAFKAETIVIVRDKENTQYGKKNAQGVVIQKSMYVSLENMVATVTPFLSKHGLSHRWTVSQNQLVTVACVLSHTLGYSVEVSMSAPPDDSGAKNKLQQIKSTLTYLKASTFESVCGLASAFANLSDDGNAAGTSILAEVVTAMAAESNPDEVVKLSRIAYRTAKDRRETETCAAIIKAKDARLAELGIEE